MPVAHHEQELKLCLPAADMERVLRRLSRRKNAGPVRRRRIVRHYYDTPALELYRNRIGLRLERAPGKNAWRQTLKYTASTRRDMLDRWECSSRLPGMMPNLRAVSHSVARKLIKPFINKKLKCLFTVSVERNYFALNFKSGVVEVAVDLGEIIITSTGKHFHFSEIEIEIKAGDAIDPAKRAIFKIAPSARISRRSKQDEGMRRLLKSAGVSR